MANKILTRLGSSIARYLDKEIIDYTPFSVHDISVLEKTLVPGDILLVEGNAKISSVIKYLTQSTWSHAAFYAGPIDGQTKDGENCTLIEAELSDGVIASPLSKYKHFNTRICRAVNLTEEDRQQVVDFMVQSLGLQYDLKNIIDLMRFLLPTPIPSRFRRKMLALGSGEPTQAICSSLIAQAYQSIKYPILPKVIKKKNEQTSKRSFLTTTEKEILQIRHSSLFTPKDFDISPYFSIVKPTLENNFDYKSVHWKEE